MHIQTPKDAQRLERPTAGVWSPRSEECPIVGAYPTAEGRAGQADVRDHLVLKPERRQPSRKSVTVRPGGGHAQLRAHTQQLVERVRRERAGQRSLGSDLRLAREGNGIHAGSGLRD